MTAAYVKTTPGLAKGDLDRVIISRKGETMKDLNEIMFAELMAAFTEYLAADPEAGRITAAEYSRLRKCWKEAAATSADLIVKHIGAPA